MEIADGDLEKLEEELANQGGHSWKQCGNCGCFREVKATDVYEDFVCQDLVNTSCYDACDKIVPRSGVPVHLRRKKEVGEKKTAKWAKKCDAEGNVLGKPSKKTHGVAKADENANASAGKTAKEAIEEDESRKILPKNSSIFEGEITDSPEEASDDEDADDEIEKLTGAISKKRKINEDPDAMTGQLCDGFNAKCGETPYEAALDHGNGKVDCETMKGRRVAQLMERLRDDKKPEEMIIRVTGKSVPAVSRKQEELLFLIDNSGAHHFGDVHERAKGRKQVAVSATMKGRTVVEKKLRRELNQKGRIALCSLSAVLEAKGIARGKLAAAPEPEIVAAMDEDCIIERTNLEAEGLTEIRVSGYRNARRTAEEEVLKTQNEKSLGILTHACYSTSKMRSGKSSI